MKHCLFFSEGIDCSSAAEFHSVLGKRLKYFDINDKEIKSSPKLSLSPHTKPL